MVENKHSTSALLVKREQEWTRVHTGPKPSHQATELEVSRCLIVIYVKPIPQICFIVFPKWLPTIVAVAIILWLVYSSFL